MKAFIFNHLITLLVLVLSLCSCDKEDEFNNTPSGNMEALWQIIDEHYCFLDAKKINWDSVHTAFMPRVKNVTSQEALLHLMDEMLDILQDGHVNVAASFNIARYWEWFEAYPENFDEKIQKNYLKTDYYISGGIKYTILDDNIGYIYYSSFQDQTGEFNMDHILYRLALCRGIIVDIRNNGGGELTNVQNIAASFTDSKVLTGYVSHKTGKGHSDFSEPYAKYLYPRSSGTYNYYKQVVVLTNRNCYSAANEFVNTMMQLPNVTIMGDQTGGGSGFPFSSELPNGWTVRFSSSLSLSPEMKQIEYGINPDVRVSMTKEDEEKGLDTIIETARDSIHNHYLH
jgi:hypothetical protein